MVIEPKIVGSNALVLHHFFTGDLQKAK